MRNGSVDDAEIIEPRRLADFDAEQIADMHKSADLQLFRSQQHSARRGAQFRPKAEAILGGDRLGDQFQIDRFVNPPILQGVERPGGNHRLDHRRAFAQRYQPVNQAG